MKSPKSFIPPYEIIEVGDIQTLSQIVNWSLDNLQIPAVWKKSRGKGITIAVLDTGIDEFHGDLLCNVLNEHSRSFHSGEPTPHDFNGHGTASSGVAGACDNELGIVGVAPDVKIIPIKVLGGSGMGQNDAIERGLKYVWEIRDKVDIVNLSLGSTAPLSNDGHNTIKDLYNYGIIIVAAAGNDPSKGVLWPARYDEVFAIGSYTPTLTRDLSTFSAQGDAIDFVCPGSNITTTFKDGKYATLNGTSFASPYCCGVLALMLSVEKSRGRKLTVDEVKRKLINNCMDYGTKGFDHQYGWGIINVTQLMDSLSSEGEPIPDVQPKVVKKTFWQRLFFWIK